MPGDVLNADIGLLLFIIIGGVAIEIKLLATGSLISPLMKDDGLEEVNWSSRGGVLTLIEPKPDTALEEA